MNGEVIDRRGLKQEMKELLRNAEVSPKGFVAVYLLLSLVMNMVDSLANSGTMVSYGNPLGIFVRILTSLLGAVLAVGFILYCMAVRRSQRAEYLTLFDGFSFAGRIIGLAVLQTFFVALWSCLFVIPGIVAGYRYQFAYYNLCENPELGCMDALDMSKKQTMGYKGQLFMLDLSYIGWGLLAALPLTVWMGYLSYITTYSALSGEMIAAVPSAGVTLLVDLLCSLWAAAVQIFYLPAYQCVQLGYYETAKRTSGVTPLPPTERLNDGWNGGDQNTSF